jgi:tetratricopeptide (TPR) repeat protein
MSCPDEDTVRRYAEARLSTDEAVEVEAHARDCPTCGQVVAAAQKRLASEPTAATQVLGRQVAPKRKPSDEETMPNEGAIPRQGDPLSPGTRLDRYTVLGLVGRGGMGEVYAAYDPDLDRRVALKLMVAGPQADPFGQDRLLREARAIAKLSHPNAVVVYEVGTFRGQVFISMEFVDGMTLLAWLEDAPRTWKQILDVYLQAARGLSAAHDAGLVHRDFKPANVMVARNGAVRVTDFGLARSVGEPESGVEGKSPQSWDPLTAATLTRTGHHAGTPRFMAPEQFRDGPIDGRTDQFSFCVALYWALYGVHPFGGTSAAEAGRGAARKLEAPITKHGAPASIHAALRRGLSFSPSERWPSMDALAAALSQDPARRRRKIATIAAAALAVGGVAAAGALYVQRSRSLCLAGPSRLADAWALDEGAARPGSRRGAVRDAIMRSGSAEPQKTWERVASILDRHASRWLGSYRDACEATHVRGEQSEDVLDLRMSCLTDNLDSMRALTHLLSGGERDVVDHAVEAAGSLDQLPRCDESEHLRSALRPPRDPIVRGKVAELNKQLKEGYALWHAGQDKRASVLADEVLARSEAIGYLPTQAEALQLKSLSLELDASQVSMAALLQRAVVLGESSGHDRVVASAAALMVIGLRDEPREAERWAELSGAVLKRMGGDPVIESWLANDLAAVRSEQGRPEEAVPGYERALALKERVLGPDHLEMAITLSNLSCALAKLRSFDRALTASRRAGAIYERWLSPRSPVMANYLSNHGDVLLAAGLVDEARTAYARSLEIMGAADRGFVPLAVIQSTRGLADVAFKRGAVTEALAGYERALGLAEKVRRNSRELADLRFQIAGVLDLDPRTSARAVQLARQALATYAQRDAFETRRREVEAWLNRRLISDAR